MSLSLRSLELSDRYRSDLNDVVSEFYVPCLSRAVRYDRAVGYFTGRALELVARGLEYFQRSGGRLRLIASPQLTEDDLEDIEAGYKLRDVIENSVVRELDVAWGRSPAELSALGLLGRLIATGNLDIKIAIVHTQQGLALYHEKIGYFADDQKNLVAFTGSLNETGAAFLDNFESIEVFRSWMLGDASRATRIADDFERLWSGATARVEVLDFPDVARERLIELAKQTAAQAGRGAELSRPPIDGWCRLPADLRLRGYQQDAVDRWLDANGRGILQMATGTGKTITALACLDQLGRQLRDHGASLLTVILVPLLDLAEQWAQELRRFGVVPIMCRDSVVSWEADARQAVAALRGVKGSSVTLVATNKTFEGKAFQELLGQEGIPLMLVADEAHHLGAEHRRALLPERARFRLALSATPERWFDPEGTEALLDYFGDVLADLGLGEAIRLGALTPYRYTPILVRLDEEEAELYTQLTAKIGSAIKGIDPDQAEPGSHLEFLLLRRAQVLGHARGKLPALERELKSREESMFQLIYCAPGNRPNADGSTRENQVQQVMDLVGNRLGLSVHQFTSHEDRKLRRQLLDRFGTGRDLRALVSMRCLDEGVDLPDARIAYMLASSSNPRQFIQRRGRILRRAPGKDRAEVIDFVAEPPRNRDLYETERKLFCRELARCVEFAKFAQNFGEAMAALREPREYYRLMDM